MPESELSRRMLFQAAGAAGVSLLVDSAVAAEGFTKSPQATAGYQERPNGGQSCGNCLHFQPPAACKVVAGKISRNGWCRIYAARSG